MLIAYSCLLLPHSSNSLISIIKVRMQEAELAKEKMHGRLACGRPLVVRLASEKYMLETACSSTKAAGEGHKMHLTGGGGMGQTSRSAKIAAIKNKLKSLEEENSRSKKQKQSDNISWVKLCWYNLCRIRWKFSVV